MKGSLFWQSTRRFKAAQVERRSINLPAHLKPFHGKTLLFMTDIHASRDFNRDCASRLMAQAASLRPDMLMLGGDLAESWRDQSWIISMLGELNPPLGAYCVPGNNDMEHYAQGDENFKTQLTGAGIVLLTDEWVSRPVAGGRLCVAGLNALHEETVPARPLFEGCSGTDLCILLAHYPASLRLGLAQCAATPHLGLCGHTHGGQLRLGPLNPYRVGYERGRSLRELPVRGWTDRLGFPVCVSQGIGTSLLPLRLNAPATIHLITFVCQSSME